MIIVMSEQNSGRSVERGLGSHGRGLERFWKGRKGTCHCCVSDIEAGTTGTGAVFEGVGFDDDWEGPHAPDVDEAYGSRQDG